MKNLEMKIWILTSLMITMIPNLPEPLKKRWRLQCVLMQITLMTLQLVAR